jgi:hypothetical protein
MYHLTEAYVMIALLAALASFIGALLFSAAIVAPLAVKTLTPDLTAAFLRPFWLRYHKYAVLGALGLTVMGTLAAPYSALPIIYIVLLSSLGSFMTICFFVGLNLIAKINLASDMQDQKAFNALHRADMALVGAGMLTGVALMIALGYVLPGHFTFWQH